VKTVEMAEATGALSEYAKPVRRRPGGRDAGAGKPVAALGPE
jgi:hypothetical protein